jgi:glycosyltransferase involved in cell wall biosynthesis
MGALTSTFIYREIQALRDQGVLISSFSTRRPAETVISAEARPFVDETVYLNEQGAGAALGGLFFHGLRHPIQTLSTGILALRDAFLAGVPSSSDRVKLLWHFTMGCLLATKLRTAGVQHVHAHFAHVPGSIAMYAARLAGIPFSVTAHANDIFQRGTALQEKAARSAFIACISHYNIRFLSNLGCDESKLTVVHCALDLEHYPMRTPRPFAKPPLIISVGRFVEKKGFEVLVDALALLQEAGIAVDCRIIGDGPLFDAVQARTEAANLDGAITFMGAQPQERVKEMFDAADMFVLPCVEARDRDLDGIPVALMEAMALGVPVVSTTVSGIPELIHSGENGYLAEPHDVEGLAEAMRSVLNAPDEQDSMIRAARATMETEFDLHTSAQILKNKFESATRA